MVCTFGDVLRLTLALQLVQGSYCRSWQEISEALGSVQGGSLESNCQPSHSSPHNNGHTSWLAALSLVGPLDARPVQ